MHIMFAISRPMHMQCKAQPPALVLHLIQLKELPVTLCLSLIQAAIAASNLIDQPCLVQL